MNYELKKPLYIFDFDGTLTRRDSFIHLLAFSFGRKRLLRCLLRYSVDLVLMKLHLFPNDRAKELVFSYFFKGMPEDEYRALCAKYARSCSYILRPNTLNKLRDALQHGEDCLVISASSAVWVEPLLAQQGLHPKVLGTKWRVSKGRLTGLMDGPNCYGSEKVVQLMMAVPDWQSRNIIAYGDSRGDKEIMALANEKHYRDFD